MTTKISPLSAHGPNIRAAYLAEIERLAEKLRPRFEAGELHAITDDELEDDNGRKSAHWKVERACCVHFGLGVKETEEAGFARLRGDSIAGLLVLAGSPSAALTQDGWNHVNYWARTAAAWDVILLARARGWCRPLAGECLGRSFAENQEMGAAQARA
jgi:hypothetical protein